MSKRGRYILYDYGEEVDRSSSVPALVRRAKPITGSMLSGIWDGKLLPDGRRGPRNPGDAVEADRPARQGVLK